MAIVTVDLSDTIATWRTKTNSISSAVGDLTNLQTSADSDIVSAVNELNTTFDGLDSDITALETAVGTLASLNTTDKTDVVSAINETYDRIPNVYDAGGTLLNP